jgi:shikimate dehydrogenase
MTGASGPAQDLVRRTVRQCVAAELPGRTPAAPPASLGEPPDGPAGPGLRLAAIGTTASHAIGSGMLATALLAEGFTVASRAVFPAPADLLSAGGWQLALVLSPWKQAVGSAGGLALSPSAATTGVVDTVLASPGNPDGQVGVNTNSWAAAAALSALCPSGAERDDDAGVLLLGAGASARSAALGIRRRWPRAQLTVSARDAAAAQELAAAFGGAAVSAADTPAVSPDVIVNATTWGETAESEERPFAFPFSKLLAPGRAFFDLNNRRSALQDEALASACVVMSGTLMQVITHASRAALAQAVLAHPAAARDGSQVR